MYKRKEGDSQNICSSVEIKQKYGNIWVFTSVRNAEMYSSAKKESEYILINFGKRHHVVAVSFIGVKSYFLLKYIWLYLYVFVPIYLSQRGKCEFLQGKMCPLL